MPKVDFKRNPDVPVVYSTVIDVRTSQYGLHLLSFVSPAATPDDVVMKDGEETIEVFAESELLVPLDAAERLIRDLASQFRKVVLKELRQGAEAEGLQMPPDDEVHVEGLDDIFALAGDRK